MSIIANNLLQGDEGYNLTRSLRFRSSASAYLNRTPASATNDNTWTWSSWVKRGELGYKNIYSTANSIGSNTTLGQFSFVNDNLYFFLYTGVTIYSELFTTAVFRDPSAWYHIVLQYDDTQATSSNRVKIYVNGVQQTLTGSYPSQNFNGFFNTAQPHVIGRYAGSGSANYFDGYMAEINFIDGQALTPSSFGETDVLTGVWKPKKYAGTYGTNGFYLPFTDNSALTTSSNVGLGRDFSGNGNYWTTNNISITAGSTYDSMTDVPTLTSATTANYCVINPLVYRNSVGQNGYSNGNLTLSGLGAAVAYFNMATVGVNASSGKFYWECQIGTASSGSYTGVTQDSNFQSGNWDAWYDSAGGVLYKGGTSFASVATATTNDVIGIAYDSTANTCAFYKNNTLLGTVTGLTSATMFPLQCSVVSAVLNLNFGQRPFSYTPPTGFVALNTFNLPSSTIVAGNKQMDVSLYSGNNSTPRSITGLNFQPDFVWIKDRSNAYNHTLWDVVRGVGSTKGLSSNSTDPEGLGVALGSTAANGYVSALNSTGFDVTSGSSTNVYVNTSPDSYVGWQWKAGGAAVTNTAGTISAQVSANPTAGFSVVTWTASNISSPRTIGHGLGVAPSLIIVKPRSYAGGWYVYHSALGETKFIELQSTGASTTSSTVWNNTAPTSSVFTVGSTYFPDATNSTYVSYCWAPIAGYSAFGSYTGNGSTDGPFVYLGFRPRFIMTKRTDAVSQWNMWDTSRNPTNVSGNILIASSSSAEDTVYLLDILSNGFKPRIGAGYAMNDSGGTYIYMAFCENPFRNALAR